MANHSKSPEFSKAELRKELGPGSELGATPPDGEQDALPPDGASLGQPAPECSACAALENAPVSTSPHANLLLHSQAGINFGATASGHADYYVCHECGTQWERDLARSEPGATWKHPERPLD